MTLQTVPVWFMILMSAEDWHTPPWEIHPGMMSTYRWMTLWNQVKLIRGKADKARSKAKTAGAKL